VDCSVSKQPNQAGNGVVVLGTHVGEEVSVAFACLHGGVMSSGRVCQFLCILGFQRWRSSVFGLVFDFDIHIDRSLSLVE
jgi:hypothetical protein